jgi:hypothetical protein
LDLYLLGWAADYPHPDNFFSPILCGNNLAFGSEDNILCDQLQAAQTESSFNTLLATYQSANRRVHDTLPLIPLVHPKSFLIERWNVAGLTPSPLALETFKDTFYSNTWVCDSTTGYTAAIVSGSGLTTTIEIPAGDVNTTTTFLYTPILTTTSSPSAKFTFAGHAFSLEAFQNNVQVPLTFATPITVVIEYSDADVLNIDESTLELYYWQGTGWANDGITIIDRDITHNRLTLTLGHLSNFALFGENNFKIALPLVMRQLAP